MPIDIDIEFKEIPRYLHEMHIDDFLDELDDFGNTHVYIHEAAKRIRLYKDALIIEQMKTSDHV